MCYSHVLFLFILLFVVVFIYFFFFFFFFFKQKTAYEMRISDWSSDVCSSDLSCWARPAGPCSAPAASPAPPRPSRLRRSSAPLRQIFPAPDSAGPASSHARPGTASC